VQNLVEDVGTGCGLDGDTVRAGVLTVLRTSPLDYTSLIARLEQPLEKPLREWHRQGILTRTRSVGRAVCQVLQSIFDRDVGRIAHHNVVATRAQ